MKKILLATSALVAMSGVAVAGDIPETPMAPMAAAWTITPSGSATLYGFFATPPNSFGVGYAYSAALLAEKTLDDGAKVSVDLSFNNGGTVDATVTYAGGIGTFVGGTVAAADHEVDGVTAPGGPSIDDVDGLDAISFDGLGAVAAPAFAVAAPVGVHYVSPKFGGFTVGLGVDTTAGGTFNFGTNGSFDLSGITVAVGATASGTNATLTTATAIQAGASVATAGFKVGADYAATIATIGAGTVTVGASYEGSGFTVGGNYSATVAAIAAGTIDGAASYTTNGFTVLAGYNATVAGIATGTVRGGVAYAGNGIDASVNGTFSLAAGNTITANANATYTFAEYVVGAGATFTTVGNAIVAYAGLDYKLNSNVTLGAAASFTAPGNAITAAAGVKVSF